MKKELLLLCSALCLSCELHAEHIQKLITCNGEKVLFSARSDSPVSQQDIMLTINNKHKKLDNTYMYHDLRCATYKNKTYAILNVDAGFSYSGIMMFDVKHFGPVKEMDFREALNAHLVKESL